MLPPPAPTVWMSIWGTFTGNAPISLSVVVTGVMNILRKYRIRIDALGQMLEEPLTIVPDRTTTLGLGVDGDRFVIRR